MVFDQLERALDSSYFIKWDNNYSFYSLNIGIIEELRKRRGVWYCFANFKLNVLTP